MTEESLGASTHDGGTVGEQGREYPAGLCWVLKGGKGSRLF